MSGRRALQAEGAKASGGSVPFPSDDQGSWGSRRALRGEEGLNMAFALAELGSCWRF